MKGKSKGWGKEKIISAIVACAVILTLSAGVYSVVKERDRKSTRLNSSHSTSSRMPSSA